MIWNECVWSSTIVQEKHSWNFIRVERKLEQAGGIETVWPTVLMWHCEIWCAWESCMRWFLIRLHTYNTMYFCLKSSTSTAINLYAVIYIYIYIQNMLFIHHANVTFNALHICVFDLLGDPLNRKHTNSCQINWKQAFIQEGNVPQSHLISFSRSRFSGTSMYPGGCPQTVFVPSVVVGFAMMPSREVSFPKKS